MPQDTDGLLRANGHYSGGEGSAEPGNPVPSINRDFDRENQKARTHYRSEAACRMSARDLAFQAAAELRKKAEQLEAIAAVLPANLGALSVAADNALFDLINRSRVNW